MADMGAHYALIQLADRLQETRLQGSRMGWIFGPGSEGVVRSLDARIASVKRAIAQKDAQAAKGQLRLLIGEIAGQRGRCLNENIASLLKNAADLLFSKLGTIPL